MNSKVYELIKKQNGEHFARTIRNHCDAVFEIPNIIEMLKYAGRDSQPLLPYLMGLCQGQDKVIEASKEVASPFMLLHRAGYHAEYADTLTKQNAIKKYFAPGEELCTFKDDTRYQNYYIVNAISYDVDNIKRMDFPRPRRQDRYGTSVMSIQIDKKNGFISIKNRYNHTVPYPDNTYNSNPDNIIYGLSKSLKNYFNINFCFKDKLGLPDNYIIFNDRIIKYNYELNNIYIGDNFYIKSGHIYEINKGFEIIIDNYILNLKTKIVKNIVGNGPDSFCIAFNREIGNKKITVRPSKGAKGCIHRHIIVNDIQIADIVDGRLTELLLPNTRGIGNDFLCDSEGLLSVDLPQVRTIGDRFLGYNEKLTSINLPLVQSVGCDFLGHNMELSAISLPQVKTIGADFLFYNEKLASIDLPQVQLVGEGFLRNNSGLTSICLPLAQTIEGGFLSCNENLTAVNLPQAKTIGYDFLRDNKALDAISLPCVRTIGSDFLFYNEELAVLNLPQVQEICNRFLANNKKLPRAYLRYINSHSH